MSDFYVGWQERPPRGVLRRAGAFALVAVLAGLACAALIASAQRPFARASFEFGSPRAFRGILSLRPHPTLRVPRPGTPPGWSRYLLVGPGKRGAGSLLDAGLDGRPVTLMATLIHADGHVALELVPGSVEELEGVGAAPATEALGPVTLRGEIADSKCHLGVMNPGRRKVHRACAINCLEGGIPPVLLIDPEGPDGTQGWSHEAQVVLLVGPGGEPLGDAVLPLVAVPVAVEGELTREDDLFVLRADPDDIRRIASP